MPNSIPNQQSIIQTELSAVTKCLAILSTTLYIVSATLSTMAGEPIKLGRQLHASSFFILLHYICLLFYKTMLLI